MRRLFRRGQKRVALPPGTLEYVGAPKVEKVKITVIDYDETHFEEKEIASAEDCFPFRDTSSSTWINIDGLHETTNLEAIGRHFHIHSLVLEDIVNTQQRPKVEDYQEYLFIVLRMLDLKEDRNVVTSEQVSLLLGPNYVLSFQEREGDVFHSVRERLRQGKGRLRKFGPGYLAYALLDAVVDHYFVVLEKLGDRISALEDDLVKEPAPEHLQIIHELKREMIVVRKSVWPLREVTSALERGESPLIKDEIRIFLRDVYDHTVQVIDVVESFRDLVGGLQDLYLSSISNKMNEVMKVLTIAATVFVPLTFVAGIYGMNFEFMPELHWRWSYPLFWAVIVGTGTAMAVFFRRRRWL